VVAAKTATTVSVTLRNCKSEPLGPCGSRTSTLPFGSAEVTLPAGAAWTPSGVTTSRAERAAAWSATPPRVLTDGRTVVRLRNNASGTTAAIEPGESVTLKLLLTAETAGMLTLTTAVKQSNDFSGNGNNFARPAGSAALVITVTDPTPVKLRFRTQPSTVQVTKLGERIADARQEMCPTPPSVEFLDAQDKVVRVKDDIEVSLRALRPNLDPNNPVPYAGLRFSGLATLTTTTKGGVATFGCTTDQPGGITGQELGARLTLVAKAEYPGKVLEEATSAEFDVLPFYVFCRGTGPCITPELNVPGGTSAKVVATPASVRDNEPDLFQFAVGLDDAKEKETYAACNPEPTQARNPYRNVVRVDVADHDKTATLRWSKQAVQWATDNGAKKWDICFAAAKEFVGRGVTAPVAADPLKLWHGTLLPCDRVAKPNPCVSRLFREAGGEQGALISIPNVPGDPKMW